MENIKKSRPPLRRSGLFNFGLIASSGQTVGDGILGVAVNEGGELVGGSDPAIVRPRVVQGFTSGVAPGATVAVRMLVAKETFPGVPEDPERA